MSVNCILYWIFILNMLKQFNNKNREKKRQTKHNTPFSSSLWPVHQKFFFTTFYMDFFYNPSNTSKDIQIYRYNYYLSR